MLPARLVQCLGQPGDAFEHRLVAGYQLVFQLRETFAVARQGELQGLADRLRHLRLLRLGDVAPVPVRLFEAFGPDLGLSVDQLLGGLEEDMRVLPQGLDELAAFGAGAFEAMSEVLFDIAVDPFEKALLHSLAHGGAEHQDHGQEEGQGGGVEGGGQALGDAAQRLFEDLGGDAGDGVGDADDGAEEAEDGDGPVDEAEDGIAAVLRHAVVIAERSHLVVELVGGAAAMNEAEDAQEPLPEPGSLPAGLPLQVVEEVAGLAGGSGLPSQAGSRFRVKMNRSRK